MPVNAIEILAEVHSMVIERMADAGMSDFFVPRKEFQTETWTVHLPASGGLNMEMEMPMEGQFHVSPRPMPTYRDISELSLREWSEKFNFAGIADAFFARFRRIANENPERSVVSYRLAEPDGIDFMAQQHAGGFWMRVIRQFEIASDTFPMRFDVKTALVDKIEIPDAPFVRKTTRYQLLKENNDGT